MITLVAIAIVYPFGDKGNFIKDTLKVWLSVFDFNSMGGHVSFITSSIFKVIMSSTWVCSFIFNIPLFLHKHDIGPIPFNINIMMILFNSAVNPFNHALLNQQFREKMNVVICFTRTVVVRPHPTGLADESLQPVQNTSRRMQFSGHT